MQPCAIVTITVQLKHRLQLQKEVYLHLDFSSIV